MCECIAWLVLPPIGQYTLETAKRPMIYAIFRALSGIALAAPPSSPSAPLPLDTSSAASHTPLIVNLCVCVCVLIVC